MKSRPIGWSPPPDPLAPPARFPLVSTAGWALTARRTGTAGQATAAEAQPHQHGGASDASGISHGHGGTAQNTPLITPRDGLVTMTAPRCPRRPSTSSGTPSTYS